ncbi:MAG TPA: S9 family peptidase [Terriglobales bacterium]|nr:S9 family peptidase [Terriglobales bacterium]
MSRFCRFLFTIFVIAPLSHSAWSQNATGSVGGTLSDTKWTPALNSGQRLIAPTDTPPRQRFQLDDLWSLSHLSDVQVAPDGHTVMVVIMRANPAENRYDRTLVAIDVANGEARTVSEQRDISSPRWSPHGDRVAFLAHDDASGHTQAFMLPSRGEARRVTAFPQGVEGLTFSPDGDSLAVIAAEAPATREGLDRFNDAFEVGHDDYLTIRPPDPLHLWLVPLSGGAPRRLTTGPGSLGTSIWGASPVAWSPDGRLIVVTRTVSAHSGDADQSHIEAVDVTTGALRRLTDRTALESSPTVSPNGRRVAFLFPHDGNPAGASDVRVLPLAGGPDEGVAASLDRSFLWNKWLPDGTLLLGANDLTKMALWVVDGTGKPRRLDLGSVSEITDVSVGADGTIAFIASEPQRPPEVYVMSPGAAGPPRRLSELNAKITRLLLGRTEPLEWTAADHIRGDGIVTFPPDFDPVRNWPLVLIIHGGPTGSSNEGFDPLAQLMAARGWIVLQPNYRGSDNLGNAFQLGIVPGAGSGPGRDVIAGVETLKARGYVDSARIAVSGWSYGGFMTVWMIGHYPGWRVAVAGAAAMDLTDMYALSDLNVMHRHAITGSPWTEGREAFFRSESPLTSAATIKTPTLLLSNTGDARVAVTQTYKLFRALQDNGIETRFVAYPTAGHLPVGPIRQRDVYRRWIEWIAEHFEH